MVHPEALQQPQYNQIGWGSFNPQFNQPGTGWGQTAGLGFGPGQTGLGQAAYGAAYGQGQIGGQPFWQTSGLGSPFGFQQRQLSQQDVGEVVRQLVPLLPQLIAQAQPQAAYGQGGIGNYANPFGNPWGQQINPQQFNQQFSPWGQQGRALSPQDVHEVVRQILPLMPQLTNALQQNPYGQNPYGFANPYGPGIGQVFAGQQNPQQQNPFWQQQGGQGMAAFGGGFPQRQLSQQDVNEVSRQLIAVIPQVIAALQANQQRVM